MYGLCLCILFCSVEYTHEVASAFVPIELVDPDAAIGKATALSQRKRHRSWLQRERRGGDGHKDAWRPRKRFRISSEKWLIAADRQLQVCTSFGGLKFVKPNWSSPTWNDKSWRAWPHMATCLDQGGDGLSAVHAMLYLLSLNVTPWFDWAHGIQNDIWTAFKAVGHYSTMLLFLLIFNICQGPDKEEGLRFQQLQECLEHMTELYPDGPEWF